ncbi:unnamed protein product, partial [Closterium sp. Naga37s-1]
RWRRRSRRRTSGGYKAAGREKEEVVTERRGSYESVRRIHSVASGRHRDVGRHATPPAAGFTDRFTALNSSQALPSLGPFRSESGSTAAHVPGFPHGLASGAAYTGMLEGGLSASNPGGRGFSALSEFDAEVAAAGGQQQGGTMVQAMRAAMGEDPLAAPGESSQFPWSSLGHRTPGHGASALDYSSRLSAMGMGMGSGGTGGTMIQGLESLNYQQLSGRAQGQGITRADEFPGMVGASSGGLSHRLTMEEGRMLMGQGEAGMEGIGSGTGLAGYLQYHHHSLDQSPLTLTPSGHIIMPSGHVSMMERSYLQQPANTSFQSLLTAPEERGLTGWPERGPAFDAGPSGGAGASSAGMTDAMLWSASLHRDLQAAGRLGGTVRMGSGGATAAGVQAQQQHEGGLEQQQRQGEPGGGGTGGDGKPAAGEGGALGAGADGAQGGDAGGVGGGTQGGVEGAEGKGSGGAAEGEGGDGGLQRSSRLPPWARKQLQQSGRALGGDPFRVSSPRLASSPHLSSQFSTPLSSPHLPSPLFSPGQPSPFSSPCFSHLPSPRLAEFQRLSISIPPSPPPFGAHSPISAYTPMGAPSPSSRTPGSFPFPTHSPLSGGFPSASPTTPSLAKLSPSVAASNRSKRRLALRAHHPGAHIPGRGRHTGGRGPGHGGSLGSPRGSGRMGQQRMRVQGISGGLIVGGEGMGGMGHEQGAMGAGQQMSPGQVAVRGNVSGSSSGGGVIGGSRLRPQASLTESEGREVRALCLEPLTRRGSLTRSEGEGSGGSGGSRGTALAFPRRIASMEATGDVAGPADVDGGADVDSKSGGSAGSTPKQLQGVSSSSGKDGAAQADEMSFWRLFLPLPPPSFPPFFTTYHLQNEGIGVLFEKLLTASDASHLGRVVLPKPAERFLRRLFLPITLSSPLPSELPSFPHRVLFEKLLTASDTNHLGRVVLPKKPAERFLPQMESKEGILIIVEDSIGGQWCFRYRFWPNNRSRMYVLEHAGDYIRKYGLTAGDTISFLRSEFGHLMLKEQKAPPAVLAAPPTVASPSILAAPTTPAPVLALSTHPVPLSAVPITPRNTLPATVPMTLSRAPLSALPTVSSITQDILPQFPPPPTTASFGFLQHRPDLRPQPHSLPSPQSLLLSHSLPHTRSIDRFQGSIMQGGEQIENVPPTQDPLQMDTQITSSERHTLRPLRLLSVPSLPRTPTLPPETDGSSAAGASATATAAPAAATAAGATTATASAPTGGGDDAGAGKNGGIQEGFRPDSVQNAVGETGGGTGGGQEQAQKVSEGGAAEAGMNVAGNVDLKGNFEGSWQTAVAMALLPGDRDYEESTRGFGQPSSAFEDPSRSYHVPSGRIEQDQENSIVGQLQYYGDLVGGMARGDEKAMEKGGRVMEEEGFEAMGAGLGETEADRPAHMGNHLDALMEDAETEAALDSPAAAVCTEIGLALLPTTSPPAPAPRQSSPLHISTGRGSENGGGRADAHSRIHRGSNGSPPCPARPDAAVKDVIHSFSRSARPVPASTVPSAPLLPPMRSSLPPAAPTLSPLRSPSPNHSPVSPLSLPGPASQSPPPAPLSPPLARLSPHTTPLDPLSPLPPPSGYPCRVCGAIFASGPALGGHMRRHLSGGFEAGGKADGGRWLDESGGWENYLLAGAGRAARAVQAEGRSSLGGREEQQQVGCEWSGRVGAAAGTSAVNVAPVPFRNRLLLQRCSADADRMAMLAREIPEAPRRAGVDGVGKLAQECGFGGVPAVSLSRTPSLVLARGLSLTRADLACAQQQQQQQKQQHQRQHHQQPQQQQPQRVVSAMLSQVQAAQRKRAYSDAMRWIDVDKQTQEREEAAKEG